jgi:hypothetical protein
MRVLHRVGLLRALGTLRYITPRYPYLNLQEAHYGPAGPCAVLEGGFVKKTFLAVALAASLLSVSALAKKFEGVISDDKCGKAHVDGSEKSMKCVEGCIKGGKAAVLVSGDNVYKLAGKTNLTKGHEGHKVVIDGKMKGDTITVNKLKMAK